MGISIRRAVFLDKDGTVIDNVPYNVDPALIRLAPGATEGMLALHRAGYRLAVVSNQSGVARGYFPESALEAVEDTLRSLLAESGVPLDVFAYCPHHPEGSVSAHAISCDCRKPAPGLIRRTAEAMGVDPSASWMVGDSLDDVEAGRRAGCRTVLIDNGDESGRQRGPLRHPHLVVADLHDAARQILEADAADRAGPAHPKGGANPRSR